MPVVLLGASIAGFLFIANGRRPVRFQLTLVPGFFAAWLTVELAPHLLIGTLVATAVLIANGALAAWPGWVGLALSAVNVYLLARFVIEAHRVHDVLETALEPVIGATAAHRPVAWKEIAFPFKLWSRRIVRRRNIPYVPGGRRRRRLDVWRSRDEREARPCLLYVPGGAWTVGISNKDQQGKPLLIEMASQGWVCFAMNYPVSPRATFPDHIVAVKQAIAWIRANAHSYGGDSRFLMVCGNSAGGHLSALAALTPGDRDFQPGFEDADTRVQAAVPLYGVYDLGDSILAELPKGARRHKAAFVRFIELSVLKRKLANDRKAFEAGSPWNRVGPQAPPFLVIHGAADTLALVEEARAFVTRLQEVSANPVVYAELPGAQHAFDQFLSIRTLYVVRAIARFGEWAYEQWRISAGAPRETPRDRAPQDPTLRT